MGTASQGMKTLDLGPTGRAVAEATRWHRHRLHLTFADLERRTDELGHRIPVLGLRRIEARARRVDVDDLTTLAAAFNVSPWKLLLYISPEEPFPDEGQHVTGLTDVHTYGEIRAWMRGDTGLTRAEREKFWERQVHTLGRTLERDEEDIRSLRAQLGRGDDAATAARLRAVEEFSADTDRALAEAKVELARLQDAAAGSLERGES